MFNISEHHANFIMYSDLFCKIYNEFGWNYFPEEFGEQLLKWFDENSYTPKNSMDLGCGTGILCEILYKNGVSAAGMDFSPGMIDIAKTANPNIHYEVADMVTFKPKNSFDLITCTGDALNHILDIKNVETIINNVYSYTNPGGYFIFDILDEDEVNPGDPIEFDYNETVKGKFTISRNEQGIINLNITVIENGMVTVEENITEIVHDKKTIQSMLEKSGFKILRISNRLLDSAPAHGTTCFIIAKRDA